MSAWLRILEVSSVSIARVLDQKRRKRGRRRRRRRKKLGIIAPSRSSLWGIQKGKEIPEKMRTGTRHQNKTTEKEKEKSSKYKENQRGKNKCRGEIALIDSCQTNRT